MTLKIKRASIIYVQLFTNYIDHKGRNFVLYFYSIVLFKILLYELPSLMGCIMIIFV